MNGKHSTLHEVGRAYLRDAGFYVLYKILKMAVD
jgi:hypothetical protein